MTCGLPIQLEVIQSIGAAVETALPLDHRPKWPKRSQMIAGTADVLVSSVVGHSVALVLIQGITDNRTDHIDALVIGALKRITAVKRRSAQLAEDKYVQRVILRVFEAPIER